MVRKVKEDLSCSENSKGLNREFHYATVCISMIYLHLGFCIWFETAQVSQRIKKLQRRMARFMKLENGKIYEAREQLS